MPFWKLLYTGLLQVLNKFFSAWDITGNEVCYTHIRNKFNYSAHWESSMNYIILVFAFCILFLYFVITQIEIFSPYRDVRRLIVAMSRARLGLYIFARVSLFQNCFELTPAFNQVWVRASIWQKYQKTKPIHGIQTEDFNNEWGVENTFIVGFLITTIRYIYKR